MNYELTWTVSKTVPTSCPDYVPDPYTGEYPVTHCAVYHCMTVTEKRSRSFESRKEAVSFAAAAPYSCDDFLLNGKPLKDTRAPRPTTVTITNGSLTASIDTCTISGTTNILAVDNSESHMKTEVE